MRHRVLLAAWVVLLLLAAGPVGAQQQVSMPDAQKIVLLVRNSLLTLNDALQTGNYTVLRDQGAPEFREANSAARLAEIFSALAAKNVDLSAVAVISPKLSEAPGLDKANGMLHLKGQFPGEPFPINFELLYQAVNGRWRLFGISVSPGEVAVAEPKAPNTISVEKN
ncbi:MAG: hypothetical protein KDJ72_13820 [Methyloceanibacter sp.]|uniref:hypothetical protein n=1 Tax=Methyloceanibacter sp. TaxID=1965321 RepID=UPI001E0FE626|nr:hypothetical protein [Methyloceanibacter sp.]MCB1444089.1 hypothetical protein [Methyloceanibacter sp.]